MEWSQGYRAIIFSPTGRSLQTLRGRQCAVGRQNAVAELARGRNLKQKAVWQKASDLAFTWDLGSGRHSDEMKRLASAFFVRIVIDISAEMATKSTKMFGFEVFPNPMRLFWKAQQGKQVWHGELLRRPGFSVTGYIRSRTTFLHGQNILWSHFRFQDDWMARSS
jgi:hypothetical protein